MNALERFEMIKKMKENIKILHINELNEVLLSYCETPEKTLDLFYLNSTIINKFAKDTSEAKRKIERYYGYSAYNLIEMLTKKKGIVFFDLVPIIPFLHNEYVINDSVNISSMMVDFKKYLIKFMVEFGKFKDASSDNEIKYNEIYKKLNNDKDRKSVV